MKTKKIKIARLSIFSNLSLIVMKLTVGVISGSISILSEAIHSSMDLLASIIAFFSVRISDEPADDRHPYGHGKFENISGVVEALLIFIASIWIIYEAVNRIFHPARLEAGHISIGFLVMLVSGVVNFIVSRRLYKVAKQTDSIALEADALHLKTDVYSSLGVAAGLFLMWIASFLTSYAFIFYLDPIIAILVAILILHESFVLFKKAYAPLLDESLSENELEKVKETISSHCSDSINFHNLRTRKAGNYIYVDFHLTVPPEHSVKEAHDICDAIEDDIRKLMAESEVTIHVETATDN